MTAPAPADGFSVFASLHERRREERRAQNANESPAVIAGRALGLDGPLTLERLVCETSLGALPASKAQVLLLRAADGKPANDVLPTARMVFHLGCERMPANDGGILWNGERLPSGRPRIVVLRTGVRRR